MQRHIVIGLGSNIDPLKHLRWALKELKKNEQIRVVNVSRIYESKALLKSDAPSSWDKDYLNAAVLIKSSISFPELLLVLKSIEKKIGRVDRGSWAPREIDLDILYTDGEGMQSDQLQVPHPYFYDRDFAYYPALELLLIDKEFKGQKSSVPSKRFFWPELVGIINITSDSFSDGKMYTDTDRFLSRIDELMSQGADCIDIGAESTRPGAQVVSSEAELFALEEKLKHLFEHRTDVPISIDTRNSSTLEKIITKYPLKMINDVSGQFDSVKAQLAVEHNIPYVLMHSLVIPAQKTVCWDEHINPIEKLKFWWNEQMNNNSFSSLHLIFDPGIGFGKTVEQNKCILRSLDQFSEMQTDVYIGHSRKSFMDPEGTYQAKDRDLLTAQWTKAMNKAYTNYLRVHNINEQKKALYDL